MDMLKQRQMNKALAGGYKTIQTTIHGKIMRIVNKNRASELSQLTEKT